MVVSDLKYKYRSPHIFICFHLALAVCRSTSSRIKCPAGAFLHTFSLIYHFFFRSERGFGGRFFFIHLLPARLVSSVVSWWLDGNAGRHNSGRKKANKKCVLCKRIYCYNDFIGTFYLYECRPKTKWCHSILAEWETLMNYGKRRRYDDAYSFMQHVWTNWIEWNEICCDGCDTRDENQYAAGHAIGLRAMSDGRVCVCCCRIDRMRTINYWRFCFNLLAIKK